MPLRAPLPEAAFLRLPAQVTPELARSRAEKMNLLFQVQLLGRAIGDVPGAFRLFLDLGSDLVAFDRALLLWHDDPLAPLEPVESRGFGPEVPLSAHWDRFLPEEPREWGRPFLLGPDQSLSPALVVSMAEGRCASLLSIPVYAGDRVHGVLQLVRENQPPFRIEDAHLAGVFALAFEGVFDSLAESGKRREIAYLDRPTGLFNRRYLEQQLEREVDRARRESEVVSLLLLEVGNLELFRTRCGHAASQALLEEAAKSLGKVCRKSDTLARYHDDLFAAILPHTPKASLGVVAQRIFEGLEEAAGAGAEQADREVTFHLCAVTYPDDAVTAETALEACRKGLERARSLPGRHYFQFPFPAPEARSEEILDPGRTGLLREATLEVPALLRLFTRLALDAVPADRVSVMVREGDDLVIQLAVGFNGQEEVVRTSRVPLSRRTISSWVAQHRSPLLVQSRTEAQELPWNEGASYRGDSFFSYPLLREGELLGVIHFSNRFDGEPFTQADVDRFSPVAEFLAGYLETARTFGGVREEFLRHSLFSLVDLMESQIPGMDGHSAHVADLARATALRLGLGAPEAERLWVSGRLHDLGKVSYRTSVLAEARSLSPRERALTQRHPLLSWKFLEGLPVQGIDRDAILYHHERVDGTGYMRKAGDEIPLSARILAVAEVYQALTSPRAYRPAIPPDQAAAYLDGHRDTLFDPRVVKALIGVVDSPGAEASAA